MNKINTLFIASTLLATSFNLPAAHKTSSFSKQLHPIISLQTKGIDWVRKCVDQYPEILWLADAKVRKTEEGQATAQGAYSEQLFGQKFIEFDRTIMTLHCLRLILDGSEQAYQQFTEAQPENVKLSKASFETLHLQGMKIVKSNHEGLSELEMTQAMEAALVLGDIGKSEQARNVFKPYGANAPDHDDFHEQVMQILKDHPTLCPTYDRLSPAAKSLLCQTANLAHYGHITHIEGGPSMFSKLKQSSTNPSYLFGLDFDFFVHSCDVSGALGHVNSQSSIVYTELSHQAMQSVKEACATLANLSNSETDAYNAYLKVRADLLGLNFEDRIDRALTRMGAMLRLFTKEEGYFLRQAVLQLDPVCQEKIISQLDTIKGEELARTPTYMPAVLVNLFNNGQLGQTKEERISQTVTLGMPFLARVLEEHKKALIENRAHSEIPLNFNKAAGVAKTSPTHLLNDFDIDSEGNVIIR